MPIWEALEYLNTLVDHNDPDIELPQIENPSNTIRTFVFGVTALVLAIVENCPLLLRRRIALATIIVSIHVQLLMFPSLQGIQTTPMKKNLTKIFALISFATITPSSFADVFELRTYTTNEGKLDALNDRFRDHTVDLFKKHGIESVGYWVPTDNQKSKNTLIYVIKHESRDAAKASWQAFISDPEWKRAAAESQKDGKILAKSPESVYMETADYSPTWNNAEDPGSDAAFELRIYKAAEGKLGKLDARFRDHTIKLFARHGIQSVAYWHPTDKPDSKDTLVYIIRHDSSAAAKKSWQAFGTDPDWKKAASESGVGRLATRPESIYMTATDYSAIR